MARRGDGIGGKRIETKQQGAFARGGETQREMIPPNLDELIRGFTGSAAALAPSRKNIPGVDKEGTSRLQGGKPLAKKDKMRADTGKTTKRGAKTPVHVAQRPRYEDSNIMPSSEAYMAMAGAGQTPRESDRGVGKRLKAGPKDHFIDDIVRAHLKARGQTAGPQAMEEGVPSMQFLKDQGILPGGGLQEPATGPGMARGGIGGVGGSPGEAVAGQNPLGPFLMQMLNPRMSPASRLGEVPTLPGAPQGFSLYNMLRLLSMFKQLYGSMPVGGQSLPAGIGGAGGPGMAGGF